MRTFRLLVLTDHSVHSAENSVYPLLQAMHDHRGYDDIDVASRGFQKNGAFFEGIEGSSLFVRTVEHGVQFHPDADWLKPETEITSAEEYDAIFLRLPPPPSRSFFKFLKQWAGKHVIFNHPDGILETSSKAFLLNFQKYTPPVQLCNHVDEIKSFAKRFPIVLKPLYNYGGKGVVKVFDNQADTGDEILPFDVFAGRLGQEMFPLLAMKFMEHVRQGDKRILVVKSEVQGASLRLPAEGSWICNVARGGSAVPAEPTKREIKMAHAVAEPLLERGILIFGFDTLEDGDGMRYLSEVNTMSIGGIRQMEDQTGRPVLARVVELIWQYLDAKVNV